MILPRLLTFVESLRRNGVRAAEGDVLDAMTALSSLGAEALHEREALRSVLACTLAKSMTEEDLFDRLFDLHFGALSATEVRAPLADMLMERGMERERAEQIAADLADDDALFSALAAGDAERVGDAVRAAMEDTDLEGLSSPLQVAYFTSRLLQRLGLDRLEGRMVRLRMHGDADNVTTAGWELEQRLRRVARRAVEIELEKRTLAKPARAGSLLHRDLRAIDPAEMEELRALVRRLAERLKTRLRARRKRARRGRVDARRTLRRSVATDAVPMRVAHARRRPQRPDVVVLCDVSDSVRAASLFMLELIAAIGDVFRRARSFVFVDRVGEVTELFRGKPELAIAAVLGGDVIPVSQNSDYGRALRAFHDAHLGLITRRTTVVILGDGRSNYRPPEEWVLAEMRKRARRVLWLSPEDRGTWGYGDSEMLRFARHADAIFVVRTAGDLARAIDRLTR